jgi:two-component system osmolarity sensor histidine kinase EnvZ
MLLRLEAGRRERASVLAGIGHDLHSPLTRLLSHGQPPLLVELQPIGHQGFRISLADCGEGIPPGLWQQAIEPFQRLDPARGNKGHCGLGLAIVERVARAHGGQPSCRGPQPSQERPQRFAVEFSGWSQPVTTSR